LTEDKSPSFGQQGGRTTINHCSGSGGCKGWMVGATQQSNTATPAIATTTTTQLQILYSTINSTIHILNEL